MQPQTLPSPGYNQYQTSPQKQGGGAGKIIIWILIAIFVAGLAAGGVYWWQQQRVDSLTTTNADLTKQLSDAVALANAGTNGTSTTFGESKVPFTFSYPSNWVLMSDAPILHDKDLPVSYAITLTAPGSINTQTPTAGLAVTQGAVITVSVQPATGTAAKDELPKTANTTPPTTTDVTVSNLAGLQYQFGSDTQMRIFTVAVKDKIRYTISFEVKGDLKSDPHYATYTELLKSFKLK